MEIKGAIFDMDGVLVNTVPLHFKAWKKMFNHYGKKFTFKDYRIKVDGIPRMDGARSILRELSKKELDRAASLKQKYFLEFLRKQGVRAYQDTLNLIRRLKKNKIKLAAISSSKNCRYILKKAKLIRLFNVIISGNDIKKGKPHPDIFILAAEKLGLKTKECIVFEDAVLGVIAARRARMKVIGVDRYHKPKKLKQADLVTGNLARISIFKLKGLVNA